eukprot:scpid70586/ scgid12829/ 
MTSPAEKSHQQQQKHQQQKHQQLWKKTRHRGTNSLMLMIRTQSDFYFSTSIPSSRPNHILAVVALRYWYFTWLFELCLLYFQRLSCFYHMSYFASACAADGFGGSGGSCGVACLPCLC